MKVLFLSFDGLTDPLGQSQIIPYLTGLAALGHEITILSAEKPKRFKKGYQQIAEALSADNIQWEYVTYHSGIPFLSQRRNLMKMKKRAFELAKNENIETLHCRSYLSALIGLELKYKIGTKFIFDIRGFWADERIDGRIWSLKNPIHKFLYRFFKKKEIEFLRNADHVVSLTENAKKEIESWPQLKDHSPVISVIPCCVDLKHFSPERINEKSKENLREKLKIKRDDFVVCYHGSIGTWYMLEEMLDFFKVFKSVHSNAKFLIITQDDTKDVYERSVKRNLSSDSIIIASSSRTEMPVYLSLCDLAVYFIKPLYSKKASSPTKLAELLAMGIPVITNAGIGDSDLILEQKNTGLLIHTFADEEYKRVTSLLENQDQNDDTRRKLAESEFSLSRGVKLYGELYKRVSLL
jgi:glycosyltransferase involved in cell wall biosynthesis